MGHTVTKDEVKQALRAANLKSGPLDVKWLHIELLLLQLINSICARESKQLDTWKLSTQRIQWAILSSST